MNDGEVAASARARMIAHIEQPDGSYQEVERGDPVCGQDFCDQCGDCLACFWNDPCYGGHTDQHRWVIYEGDSPHAEQGQTHVAPRS